MIRYVALLILAMASACAAPRTGNLLATRDADYGLLPGTFAVLDGDLERTEREGRIVGGQLALAHGGELIYSAAFGTLGTGPGSPAVARGTLFDTASLAKPLAGVPTAILPANDPLRRDFLDHTSGLDDRTVMPELRGIVLGQPGGTLADTPAGGGCYRYANAGYALLAIFQGVGEEQLTASFWEPLGARFTFAPAADAAVAESGTNAEGRVLAGEPYDPLAALMMEGRGILPLHSGLFACADDVALSVSRLAEEREGPLGEWRELLLGSVRRVPRCDGSGHIWISAGGMVSPTIPPYAPDQAQPGRIRYHTGYTGCLLWIDERSGVTLALLTNASLSDSFEAFDALSHRVVRRILQGGRQR